MADEKKNPQQVREMEAARVKKSEEDGKAAGAYNPSFMPGFRPDVYNPEGDTVMQPMGDGEVRVAIRAGEDAIIRNSDQHMSPTAGVKVNAERQPGGGTGTPRTGGPAGAATARTGTTATGEAIESGQGSTDTSRVGSSGRTGGTI